MGANGIPNWEFGLRPGGPYAPEGKPHPLISLPLFIGPVGKGLEIRHEHVSFFRPSKPGPLGSNHLL